MTNKYIRSVLDERNNFFIAASFQLFGAEKSCKFKIDTGCNTTCIPIKKLNVSDESARILKQIALDEKVPYSRSYGVSDTEEVKANDRILIEQGKAINCKSLKFKHEIDNLILGGCNVGKIKMGINYDRTGNVLLGMDILKDWDIHIGKNKMNETILLACPNNQLNDEYYKALSQITNRSKDFF